MTNIDVIDKKGKYIIDMNGHSGESEICAAVSTLTAALEGWLKNSSLKYSYMPLRSCFEKHICSAYIVNC